MLPPKSLSRKRVALVMVTVVFIVLVVVVVVVVVVQGRWRGYKSKEWLSWLVWKMMLGLYVVEGFRGKVVTAVVRVLTGLRRVIASSGMCVGG